MYQVMPPRGDVSPAPHPTQPPAGRSPYEAARDGTDKWADWRDNAACGAPDVDIDLFYGPDSERAAARYIRVRAAKAICASCVVRPDCLNEALQKPEWFGVWGGQSEEERNVLRRGNRAG